MINYFDRGCNIQFGKFFESMNQKMVLQLMLTAAALFLTGLFAPQFLVWPDLSFEFLCVPLALILILPDLFYQNSRFNQKHTYTLSIVYGAMALSLMPHLRNYLPNEYQLYLSLSYNQAITISNCFVQSILGII